MIVRFNSAKLRLTLLLPIVGLLGFISLGLAWPEPAGAVAPMRFERLSQDDGLSQDAALALLQDRAGYIWIGTEDGLNRFDGYQFRHFDHSRDDPGSLVSDFINDLAQDEQGNIWIATDGGGVARLDPRTEKIDSYQADPSNPASLSSNQITLVRVDSQQRIWLGTVGFGMDILEPAAGKAAALGPLRGHHIRSLSFANDGSAWVGTDQGLLHLDGGGQLLQHYVHQPDQPNSLPGKQVHSLQFDRHGELWVGTNNGVGLLDAATGLFQAFVNVPDDPLSLPGNLVEVIHEDGDGRLWFGTDAGLALLTNASLGKFATSKSDLTDPNSLSNDQVMTLMSDRSGILWVGTKLRGVNRWNPRAWSFGHNPANPVRGFGGSYTSSFTEDQQGQIWVGSRDNGITVIDTNDDVVARWQADAEVNRINGDQVMTLLTDRRGLVWAGTMRDGLMSIDPQSGAVHSFTNAPDNPASLSTNGVMSLFEDTAGALWVGTFGGGINRLDPGASGFAQLQHDPDNPNSLSDSRVTAFAEDDSGTIWIGTVGGGLNAYDRVSGQFTHYRNDPADPASLSSNTVYSLHIDARGELWIGTRAGLNRLALGADRFTTLTVNDGLANDTINGIEQDGSGALWLSTNRGLTRYWPQSGESTNFNRSHGLQGDEFNFGAHYRTQSGELLFGGPNGFNRFRPGALEHNQIPPPVVLTSVQKFNRPADLGVPHDQVRSLEFGYRDDVITFEFAALDFSAPQRNQFRYKLDGFDKDWLDLGSRRRVTYTNLDGGRYSFQVQAANSDGHWNDEGLVVAVDVQSPPWRTAWAYALYALLALAVLAGLWRVQRVRLGRERMFRHRLQQEVRQRTGELAERNNQLLRANEKLERASFTDPLTGLSNRRFLASAIEADLNLVLRNYHQEGRGEDDSLAFIMVDLDHFKPINDSFGHNAGDQVLLGVRDVLRQVCRSSDIVVRWGGDEFLVVARQTNADSASALAERIRSQIAHKIFGVGDGQVARTSASIGFACFPFLPGAPDRIGWEEVTRIADLALYEAKNHRNAWVGYVGTSTTDQVENLFILIKDGLQELIEAGQLSVCSSRQNRVRSA